MSVRAVLACGDLFFASKVFETARHTGAAVERLRDAAAIPGALAGASLLLVDLDARDLDAVALVREARRLAPALRIVAFVRHEEADRIRAAREAGASEVLARGAFAARLPALLAG